MQTVTIHDAKTNLSKYIAAVKQGKQVYIGGFGKPEVKLVQVSSEELVGSQMRDFSSARNKIVEHEDSFTQETDAEVARLLGVE